VDGVRVRPVEGNGLGALWLADGVITTSEVLKRHTHALKHSLARHLIAGNVNLALVKQYLRHKAIGSTMKHVAVSDRQASQAAYSALTAIY